MKIILLFAVTCLLTPAYGDDAEVEFQLKFIRQRGYEVQNYSVVTPDGYILQLLRMAGREKSPPAANKTVVLLMHGLLCSSFDWLALGENKALPFLLSDAGYNVFLGNARGNALSRRHTHLSPTSRAFWDFSWHEIGTKDVPALIDFALSLAGQTSLHLVGHSQGTTSFFVGASQHTQQLQSRVRTMHALAPVAFMSHLRSPLLRALAPMAEEIRSMLTKAGIYEFMPTHDLLVQFGMHACQHESPFSREICANALFLLCGYDSAHLNRSVLAQVARHTPAGASIDQLVHYAQEINSGEFRMFDHGLVGNVRRYGRVHPPRYNLSAITTPVYLYYGDNDWMAAVSDVRELASKLGNLAGNHRIARAKFNHLDFVYGSDADELVYARVIETIASVTPN